MNKIVIAVVAVIAAFLSGYFLAPEKTKEVQNTVYVDRVVKVNEKKRIVEKPDGTKETVVVTVTEEANKEQSTLSVVEKPADKPWSAYGLIGYDSTLRYGAHVSKQFIGPLSLGAFGLTNGTFGLSVGMRF